MFVVLVSLHLKHQSLSCEVSVFKLSPITEHWASISEGGIPKRWCNSKSTRPPLVAQLKYSTTITVSGAIEATILHAIRVLNAPRTLITDCQSEVINLQNNGFTWRLWSLEVMQKSYPSWVETIRLWWNIVIGGQMRISQELRMLSMSVSDCQSLTLNVMIQVS